MFKELLGRKLLFFDGATGTQLQAAGLETGEAPDIWNITHADIVQNIHLQYLKAGCDIITTNTFGSNAHILAGTGYTVKYVVEHAVLNAKAAAQRSSRHCFIALGIGPTGKMLKPLGDMRFEEAYSLFSETVIAGTKAGVDIILFETLSDAYELKAAILAAKENCDLPVIASVTMDENGKMLTGGGVDVVVTLLEGLRVDAIGFNCGFGPEQWTPHITRALEISSTPILLMPNAGLPHHINGATQYNVDAEEFSISMRQNAENGVWLLGGCCGTTPAHIETLIKNCTHVIPYATTCKNITAAASYSKTVVFGERPVIIGERINPTGKPRLKQALMEGDYDFVLREGITQLEQGADMLDVNAGMPEIDEQAVLPVLVEQLQSIIDAPLQIDTADIGAMAQAMRIYNGKPVINSVNGKASVMEAVFPLVQKYGGVLIALTLDEDGIPETAQGRINIAKTILKRAEEYGIKKEAFVFDPLTMAVSAKQNSACVTLECVQRLTEELGVKTSLGVSNVSFGLPRRDILNAAFFSLSLHAGLDAAILNPNVKTIRQAIEEYANGEPSPNNAATDALIGKDEQFARYIACYGGQQAVDTEKTKGKSDITLCEAVLKGLKQQAAHSAQCSLKLNTPIEVIEKELIPALNTAGQRFEQGTMYLPQLLMCSEAAKNAFSVIHTAMGSSADDTIGTVVIATVEGDVHDIGKNVVKALLENYRFHVIDLGKDVPAYSVVEAVQKHNAKLAGLSALMTTTVINMEKTIKELRKAVPDCKIMCGGAVLTKEYAESIGAHCYVKDAMASIRYAQHIYTKP
ncbi:MAG: homocysteine S-methyltransferase family protein [Treponema sp.]|jgi:5-methyltetrahydrofolate--homocysteine methyltransferase|nr:homocysteine S-methyltransferase family protein [Treponema sp.]